MLTLCKAARQRLWQLLRADRVAFVRCAPPCGTFTLARNIPIAECKLKLGVPNVRQLRSERYPEGLPPSVLDMTATELADARAEAAYQQERAHEPARTCLHAGARTHARTRTQELAGAARASRPPGGGYARAHRRARTQPSLASSET